MSTGNEDGNGMLNQLSPSIAPQSTSRVGLCQPEVEETLCPPQGTLQHWWEHYQAFVRKHHVALHLVDEALTRVVFWTPSTSKKREVLYGLLSIHRMLLDAADNDALGKDSYGTTVEPDARPIVPANNLRRILTLSHCLMPTVLDLSQRPAMIRLYFERLKFIIRLVLLTSYWTQLWNDYPRDSLVIGLLREGGICTSDSTATHMPTVSDQLRYMRRRHYVGRRTGRRVGFGDTSQDNEGTQPNYSVLRVVLGELLHCYRPLYWAQAEQINEKFPHRSRWLSWIISMVMDLASLGVLDNRLIIGNDRNCAEWKRRRMRLFLYMLREPMWGRSAYPTLRRLSALVGKVPLLGELSETYLIEWLACWRHPFFAEQD